MNVIKKKKKENVHINKARQCCKGTDDCTHTHTHIPTHKHNTACWGEGQYYSVEMLREEKSFEFVFEGRGIRKVSNILTD